MTNTTSKTTAFAATVFAFCVASAAPALAAHKAPLHRQLAQPGYARVMMYAPSHDTTAVDRACDLPSSTCSNDERIYN